MVIPAEEKDLATLNLSIRALKKYGQNIGRIVVISSEKLTDEAEWVSEERFPFSREDVIEGYRGLLKWQAPCVIKGLSRHVLMVDPEVIFCRPVRFLSRWGVPLYDGECPSQCVVSQKVLEQVKSWRALINSSGHFSLNYDLENSTGLAFAGALINFAQTYNANNPVVLEFKGVPNTSLKLDFEIGRAHV